MLSGVGSKPWRERPRIVKVVLLVVERDGFGADEGEERRRRERWLRKVW